MKSSRPSSAHWMSSNRRLTGSCSASRSKNRRQPANSASRPPAGGSAWPSRASRQASMVGRSAGSVTCSSTARRDALPGRRLVVRLEQAAALADHLAERPERHALAVGRRATLVPERPAGQAVRVLGELPGEAALADAGLAGDRDESGATFATGRVEGVADQAELDVAADERRLEALGPADAPGLGHDRAGLDTRVSGSALPLSSRSPAGSNAIAPAADRRVLSPTRTVPGAAAVWRRLAVFTRSPATSPWLVAPRVTAASPVRTPARAWSVPGRPDRSGRGRRRPCRGRHGPRARRRPRAWSGRPTRP